MGKGAAILLLASVMALGQEASPADVDALIVRLGDPEYSVRLEASAALERLGTRAVPHLRERLDSGVSDPEVQARVVDLLDRLDWPEPSRVGEYIELALRTRGTQFRAGDTIPLQVRISNRSDEWLRLGTLVAHLHVEFTPHALLEGEGGAEIPIQLSLDTRHISRGGEGHPSCNVGVDANATVILDGQARLSRYAGDGAIRTGRYGLRVELDYDVGTNHIEIEVLE